MIEFIIISFIVFGACCGVYLYIENRFTAPEEESKEDAHGPRLEEKIFEVDAKLDKLNRSIKNYPQALIELQTITRIQKKQLEAYRKCFEELGAEFETDRSIQFDPKQELGLIELEKVHIHFDRVFLAEGCNQHYEMLKKLNEELVKATWE